MDCAVDIARLFCDVSYDLFLIALNNYCKRVGLFYAKLLLDRFSAFVLGPSVTSCVTFSRFTSSF